MPENTEATDQRTSRQGSGNRSSMTINKDGQTNKNRIGSGKYYDIASALLGKGKADLEELFLNAARDGDYDRIEAFLLRRSDVIVSIDVKDKRTGNTPLIWAAKRGHTKIVQLLLKHGADITLRNYEGQTAVEVASPGIKTILLDSVDRTTESSHRLLLQAAWQGNIRVLKKLLNENKVVDINCQNEEGLTALLLVCRDIQLFERLSTQLNRPYNPVEVVQELLDYRANVHAVDGDEKTCLHYASQSKALQASAVVQVIIQAKPNLESKDKRLFAPIHCASQIGNVDCIEALLEGGSFVNCRGFAGTTPLHITAYNDHEKAACSLLKNGADITLTDDRGLTAFDLARGRKMKSTLKEAWTEATQSKQSTNLAPLKTPGREDMRASTDEPPKRRKGEVIFDGLPSNSHANLKTSPHKGRLVSRHLSLREKATRAEEAMMKDIENGNFTPSSYINNKKENDKNSTNKSSCRDGVRRLGLVRGQRSSPSPLPKVNSKERLPAISPDRHSLERNTDSPAFNRNGKYRRSFEDGKINLTKGGKPATFPAAGGGRHNRVSPLTVRESSRMSPVNVTEAEREQYMQINRVQPSSPTPSISKSYKKHRRSGSDTIATNLTEIAETCNSLMNANQRGRSISLSHSEDYSVTKYPLRETTPYLPLSRETTQCSLYNNDLPKRYTNHSSEVVLDLDRMGLLNRGMQTPVQNLPLYPTSSKILPPTPTFGHQKSHLESKMMENPNSGESSKEPSPRSDDDDIIHDKEVKMAFSGTLELLRSRSIYKDEFILEESRPRDLSLRSSSSEESHASKVSGSSHSSNGDVPVKEIRKPVAKQQAKTVQKNVQPHKEKSAPQIAKVGNTGTSKQPRNLMSKENEREEDKGNNKGVVTTNFPFQNQLTNNLHTGASVNATKKVTLGEKTAKKPTMANKDKITVHSKLETGNSNSNANNATGNTKQQQKDKSGTTQGKEIVKPPMQVVSSKLLSNVKDEIKRVKELENETQVDRQKSPELKETHIDVKQKLTKSESNMSELREAEGKSETRRLAGNVSSQNPANNNGKKAQYPTRQSTASTGMERSKTIIATANQNSRNSVPSYLQPTKSSVSRVEGGQETSSKNRKTPSQLRNSSVDTPKKNSPSGTNGAPQVAPIPVGTSVGGSSATQSSGTTPSATLVTCTKSSTSVTTVQANYVTTKSVAVSSANSVATSSSTTSITSGTVTTSVSAKSTTGATINAVPSGADPVVSTKVSKTSVNSVTVKPGSVPSKAGSASVVAKSGSFPGKPGTTGAVTKSASFPSKSGSLSAATKSGSFTQKSSSANPVTSTCVNVTPTFTKSAVSAGRSTSTSGSAKGQGQGMHKSSSAGNVTKSGSGSAPRSSTSGNFKKSQSDTSLSQENDVTATAASSGKIDQKSSNEKVGSSNSASHVSATDKSQTKVKIVSTPVTTENVKSQLTESKTESQTQKADVSRTVNTSSSDQSQKTANVPFQYKPASAGKAPLVEIVPEGTPRTAKQNCVEPVVAVQMQTPVISNPFEDWVPNIEPVLPPKMKNDKKVNTKGVSATSYGYVVSKPTIERSKTNVSVKSRAKSAKKGGKDAKPSSANCKQATVKRKGAKSKEGKGSDEASNRPKSGKRRVRSGKRRRKTSLDTALSKQATQPDIALISGIGWHLATKCIDTSDVIAVKTTGSDTGESDSDDDLDDPTPRYPDQFVVDFDDEDPIEFLAPDDIPDYVHENPRKTNTKHLHVNIGKNMETSSSSPSPRFMEVKLTVDDKGGLPKIDNDGYPPMNLDLTQASLQPPFLLDRSPRVQNSQNLLPGDFTSMIMNVGSEQEELEKMLLSNPDVDEVTAEVHRQILMGKLTPIPESPSLRSTVPIHKTLKALEEFDRNVKDETLNDLLGLNKDENRKLGSTEDLSKTSAKSQNRNSLVNSGKSASNSRVINSGSQSINSGNSRRGDQSASSKNSSAGKKNRSVESSAGKRSRDGEEVGLSIENVRAALRKVNNKTKGGNASESEDVRRSRDVMESADPVPKLDLSPVKDVKSQSVNEQSTGRKSKSNKSSRRERKFSETKSDDREENENIDDAIEEILSNTCDSSIRSNRTLKNSSRNSTLTDTDRQLILKMTAKDESPFHAKMSSSVTERKRHYSDSATDLSVQHPTDPELLKVFQADDFKLGQKVRAMVEAGADSPRVKAMMNVDNEAKQLAKIMNSFRHMELYAGPGGSVKLPKHHGRFGHPEISAGEPVSSQKPPLPRPGSAGAGKVRSAGKFTEIRGSGSVQNSNAKLQDVSGRNFSAQMQKYTDTQTFPGSEAIEDELANALQAATPENNTIFSQLSGQYDSMERADSACTSLSSQSAMEETIQWKKGNVLGKGAFGTVWCGLTSEGQLIAVKQIELTTTEKDKAKREYEKVQEEVELLKTLNHKNIVGYLGTSLEEEESVVSIFMQFVPGGSIASILARFGALDEAVFRRYTKQILEGVQYLHANDVIHRDIKGGNVMLMPNGIIKLIDFGCAKRLCINLSMGQSQILKSMKGTPYWMAPEVVNETGHGKKSDIWSVGCTIFEMATRKPPWADMNPMAAIFAIGSDRPVPQLPNKFSPEAIDFIDSCLTRDQNKRPSATELLQHNFILKRKNSKK